MNIIKTLDDKNKYSILAVDDEPKNIQLIGNILKQEGYEVEFALSGEEALEWAFSGHFDLILLDIVMPGMNGLEVCKKLKSDDKTKEIPVIFITVKEDADDEVKGLELGAADYIAKPFHPTVLKARIKTHLDLRTSHLRLQKMNRELRQALDENKALRKILPICCNCKKIRNADSDPMNNDSWIILESYLLKHQEIKFSHGICPECSKKLYPELY